MRPPIYQPLAANPQQADLGVHPSQRVKGSILLGANHHRDDHLRATTRSPVPRDVPNGIDGRDGENTEGEASHHANQEHERSHPRKELFLDDIYMKISSGMSIHHPLRAARFDAFRPKQPAVGIRLAFQELHRVTRGLPHGLPTCFPSCLPTGILSPHDFPTCLPPEGLPLASWHDMISSLVSLLPAGILSWPESPLVSLLDSLLARLPHLSLFLPAQWQPIT